MIVRILCIIAIVLLFILAFAALVLLLILFVPVKYRLNTKRGKSGVSGSAKALWLTGLACAKAKFEGGTLSYRVRILFFPVLKGQIGENEENAIIGPDAKKGRKAKKKKGGKNVRDESLNEEYPPAVRKTAAAAGKIKSLYEKLKTVKYIWDAPVTKRALKAAKLRLFELLNHIKPKKIKGRITISLNDPDKTALAYAAAVFAAESLGADLVINPDFNKESSEEDNLDISGRIFAGCVLLCALKTVKNRDIRRVVKYIRRNL